MSTHFLLQYKDKSIKKRQYYNLLVSYVCMYICIYMLIQAYVINYSNILSKLLENE